MDTLWSTEEWEHGLPSAVPTLVRPDATDPDTGEPSAAAVAGPFPKLAWRSAGGGSR